MIMEPFVLPGTVTKDRWESFRGEVEKRAAAAKRIAEKNHLLFVPLQKKFDDALLAAPAEYWLDDGVHPTPAGHQIIKNAWIEAFEQLRR